MDRRFLLAVVLSAVVLIVFQVWLAPKPSPEERARMAARADSLRTAQASSSGVRRAAPDTEASAGTITEPATPAGTPEAAPGTLASLASEPQTTTVETPLYRAEFTNRGARLTSFKLRKFDDKHNLDRGDLVQLVRPGEAEFDVRLETESGLRDLGDVLYGLQEESLPGGGKRLTYTAGSSGGIRVTKVYTLPADGYMIDLQVSVQAGDQASGYRLGWDGGIPQAEASDKQYKSAAGTIVLLGKERETERPGSFKKTSEKELEGNVRWAGVRNKYFMAVMIPPPETSSRVIATGSATENLTGAEVAMPLLHGSGTHDFKVYLGPMEYDHLKALGYDLDQAVDLGWKIFRPISKLLLTVMVWMYGFIPNYGIVIIIISAATKFLFYPLTRTSVKSMRAMQRIQPEMTAMKEKYKDDPQRQQKEMMVLYKKYKVNPMGGCLPIVVQMPVFFALYAVLSNSIAMRGADFVWWINDLSSPDTIATVGGLAIHVLPFLLFLTTVAQQKLTPTGGDPRQKMIGYMMPVVMLFIFYSFPAGLNLYWTVNNILTVAQQWAIHREEPLPAPAASTA